MTEIILTDKYLEGPKARSVPGSFFDFGARHWIVRDPPPMVAVKILKLFPHLATEHPELTTARDDLIRQVRPFGNADKHKIRVKAPRVSESLRLKLSDFLPFQSWDLGYGTEILLKHKSLYVGWERGLGKTLGACALIDAMSAKAEHMQSVLVVCPNTAKSSTWKDELESWLPGWQHVILRNARAQRYKDLAYAQQLHRASIKFVLVVHYEALDVIDGDAKKGWQKLGIKWDMVIADEVHRIANVKAKMTRALKRIKCDYKVAMSGSIIANAAEDLFSPLNWLFPKHYSSKWRDWNDRFLEFSEVGYNENPHATHKECIGIKMSMLPALREELGVFMLYRRKEDELDLPPKRVQTMPIDMSPEQTRVYNELLEMTMSEMPDGTLLKATNQLSLLTKLRQVATGLSLVTGEPTGDSSKLDLAMDMIKDNPDEEFVVFSWYKQAAYEMQRRCEKAGISCFVVTGDIPQSKRAEAIRSFQAGEGRVFIGTISTLGESVTLHRASNAIFLDRSWNPSLNDQAADRIYRIGQTKSVLITNIVARGTVDELNVQPVIDDKTALRRLILGD